MDALQKLYADYRDDYTIQQLRAEFLTATPQRRIALLDELVRSSYRVPTELARLAAEDSDSRVRGWCAQYCMGDLDDTLRDRLIADPDPLVRAKGIEGGGGAYTKRTVEGASYVLQSEEFPWQTASELERLAYLREPLLGIKDILLKLFDPENHELGVNQRDRRRYAIAYIAASQADGRRPFFLCQEEIVEMMPKWPKEAGIQALVYRYCELGKFADVIYRHCDQPLWRAYMLENVLWRNYGDPSDRLGQLARKDSDHRIRELAHMGMGRGFSADKRMENAIDEAVRTQDEAALRGLAKNKNLNSEELFKVGRQRVRGIKELADETHNELEHRYFFNERQRRYFSMREYERQATNQKRRRSGELAVVTTKIEEAISNIEDVMVVLWRAVRNGWISATLVIIVGVVLYVFTGKLGWTILTGVVGVWAVLGLVLCSSFPTRRWRTVDGYRRTHLMFTFDYPNERDEWHAEFEKKFSEDEYKELSRLRSLIWQTSRGSEGGASVSTEAKEPLIDPNEERHRIEKYKVALADAKLRAEAQARAERREEILKRREEMRKKRRSKA